MLCICRPMPFQDPINAIRAIRWGIAALSVFALIYVGQRALADPIKPIPVEKDHLSVDLGRSSVFQAPSDIKDIRVADDKVCTAAVIGNDRNAIAVTGLKRGSTTLTAWFTKPNTAPQTYVIDVVTASDAYKTLSDFIHLQFPNSTITLTPVPSSTKVIVSGAVTSYHEWEQILVLIDGTIPRADLILRVAIPFHPCPPCPPPCPIFSRGHRVFR